MNLNNLVVLVITVYFISSIIWHFVWVIIITNNIPVSLWCCRYDHSHFDGTHCSPDQCRLSSVADRWLTDVFFQMETGDPAMNSVHRGLLARSFQRVHSQTSSLLSSDHHHRSDDVLCYWNTVPRGRRCWLVLVLAVLCVFWCFN